MTTKAIRAGDQITVDYGKDYWSEGEKCRCAICEAPMADTAPGPSRIVDQEIRAAAKKTKNKRQKAKKKEKVRAAKKAQVGAGRMDVE